MIALAASKSRNVGKRSGVTGQGTFLMCFFLALVSHEKSGLEEGGNRSLARNGQKKRNASGILVTECKVVK